MPKVRDKGILSKRQRRRLVEQEYKKLRCINTQNAVSITRELSPPAVIVTNPNSAMTSAIMLNSTELDNNIPNLSDSSPETSFCNCCSFKENSDTNYRNDLSLSHSELPFTTNDKTLDKTNEQNFQTDLRNWAISRNISHADLDALLQILHVNGIDVPVDSRTLTKTPRNIKVIEMNPGNYFHFGLRPGLLHSISQYFSPENYPAELKLNISVDGLPLTKSSGSQFWPILTSIETDFATEPFLVGIYHGYEKPSDSNEFLKYFVADFQDTSVAGIKIKNMNIAIKINAFICDAPAKSYITGTKGHNAYFGCGKCIQEGEFIQNRVTYPEVDSRLRTDDSFRQKMNEEHHRKLSILETLPICMISTFPLDYMHLVCIGVMKKLLQFWVKGKKDVRMTNTNLIRASNHLMSLSSSISKEFARKPRHLQDVDRFKATELRQLLLYTGLIIFKDTLTSDQYNHFLSLSIVIRILASSDLHLECNDYARSLLIYFVKTFPLLYGHQYVSYNIHNLVHLCDDVQAKGPLDKFCAFKFENHMQKIKKMVKTSGKPLQQFINRHEEQRKLNSITVMAQSKTAGYPVIKYQSIRDSGEKRAIKSLQYHDFFLSTRSPNNAVV